MCSYLSTMICLCAVDCFYFCTQGFLHLSLPHSIRVSFLCFIPVVSVFQIQIHDLLAVDFFFQYRHSSDPASVMGKTVLFNSLVVSLSINQMTVFESAFTLLLCFSCRCISPCARHTTNSSLLSYN